MSKRSRLLRAAVRTLTIATLSASLASEARAENDAALPPEPVGENIIRLDTADAVILSQEAAYWVVDTPSPSIPVRLDTPSIGTGSMNFVTFIQPGIGTIFFEPGQQNASASVQFPAGPPEDTYQQWGAKWAYFALTKGSGGITDGFPNTLYFLHVYETAPGRRGDSECAYCFFAWIAYVVNAADEWVCGRSPKGGPAQQGLRGGSNPATTLQRYRDEVLAANADGLFYTNLYVQHSLDLSRAIVAAPSLAARLFNAQGPWIDGISALVNGTGGSFVVTQQMEDDLNALLDTFEAVGSPALQQMLAFERGRLQLDQIAGLTMTEYQEQIEDLGGPTSIEQESWGRVKALYR
jgi:hypothetical protein